MFQLGYIDNYVMAHLLCYTCIRFVKSCLICEVSCKIKYHFIDISEYDYVTEYNNGEIVHRCYSVVFR